MRTLEYVASHSEHTYRVEQACTTQNATCPETPVCDGGYVYNIWEDGHQLPWQACLSTAQATQINGLTPGFVIRAFQRLTWPASHLDIQPPHGRTLVNLPTNLYTTNTHPTTQTITLLGQHVTIQATPTTYTWHYGDHTTSQTTDPGAPYPDLRNTHCYLHPTTTHPSVDTTYHGRYRVNNGPWHTILDPLTVPGPTRTLQIVTATPHLLGY